MGDLVKFEEFVTEVTETKRLRGGNLPIRIYTITIMEPDAINIAELEKLKKEGLKAKQEGADKEIVVKNAGTNFDLPTGKGEPKPGDTVVASPTTRELGDSKHD